MHCLGGILLGLNVWLRQSFFVLVCTLTRFFSATTDLGARDKMLPVSLRLLRLGPYSVNAPLLRNTIFFLYPQRYSVICITESRYRAVLTHMYFQMNTNVSMFTCIYT